MWSLDRKNLKIFPQSISFGIYWYLMVQISENCCAGKQISEIYLTFVPCDDAILLAILLHLNGRRCFSVLMMLIEVDRMTCKHRRRNWGALGARAPQEINKEVPFSILKNPPFFFRKKCPRSAVPPKFEVLPTSLRVRNFYSMVRTQLSLNWK